MPHRRRRLPDLCLISVFKTLTPNDLVKAAEMSPRCAVLVRAANRRVKMLVITSLVKFFRNCFSLASEPVMKLLPAVDEPFPDYPMITIGLSKCNCFLVNYNQLFDQATVKQIVNVFSAVTDLKFSSVVSCANQIALLQCSQWANQLINLAVYDYDWIDAQPTNHRIIAAINALAALQCLALTCNMNAF